MDCLRSILSAGLHDSRVSYWEPAKWVAKTRWATIGHPVILLLTQMEAGHAGVSGVFSQLREIALEQAFLLRATCVAGEVPTQVVQSALDLSLKHTWHAQHMCSQKGRLATRCCHDHDLLVVRSRHLQDSLLARSTSKHSKSP